MARVPLVISLCSGRDFVKSLRSCMGLHPQSAGLGIASARCGVDFARCVSRLVPVRWGYNPVCKVTAVILQGVLIWGYNSV